MTKQWIWMRMTLWVVLAAWAHGAAAAPGIVLWNSQQNGELVAEIAADFARSSGIKVETNWINQADLRASLLRHANAGDMPDVVLVPADFLAHDKELRYSEVPLGKAAAELEPNAVAAGRFEGRLLGAPVFWGNHLMLYYNRDLVKKPARSFAEMAEQNKAFSAKGVKALGMNFAEMFWLAPFYAGFGGWPLDAQGQITLDNPAMVRTLQFYFGLVDKGLTMKECRYDCAFERFIAGDFAYAINGDWAMRELREKMGARLGVATLPAMDGGSAPVPMFSAYLLVFPNDGLKGPKREALLKLVRYMQGPAAQRRWFDEAALLPVNRKAFREAVARADDPVKGALAQLKTARAMPNDRGMPFAWDAMAKGFSALYNGRADAAQAARLMQQQAERAQRRAGE